MRLVIEIAGLYILGYFVTFYACAIHWKGDWKQPNLGRNNNDMLIETNHGAAIILIPIFWPIILVFALPVILVVQFFKLVFHLGVYGDLTPRLAAITRRANRYLLGTIITTIIGAT